MGESSLSIPLAALLCQSAHRRRRASRMKQDYVVSAEVGSSTHHHAGNSNSNLNSNSPDSNSPRRMGGRMQEIAFACALMTIPMAAFSALLLGLIYYYRVVPSSSSSLTSDTLRLPGAQASASVIYVQMSATTLTTVASWSSTVATILVGSAVTLISYPMARRLLVAARTDRPDVLPTSFQLSLMLSIINSGSPQSFFHWLRYTLGWRGRKQAQAWPMNLLTLNLSVALALSILVFAADTWFHFATKTVNLTQVYPISTPSNRSVGLSPRCYDVKTPHAIGCTINQAATAQFLMNGQSTLSVIANLSDTMRIQTISRGTSMYAYVGNPPSALLDSNDYTAHSWALESKCAPVTSKCINEGDIYGVATDYKCPFAMEGQLFTPENNVMSMTYFTDGTATNNETLFTSLQNPYYYAAIVAVNQNFGHGYASDGGEVTSTTHGADLFAVFCNTTVYDLEYTSVNGTITRFITTPSNATLANMVQGSQQYTTVGDPLILQGASVGAIISTSGQGVADYFALTYSQTALGVASAGFDPQPPVESQRRETILVARIRYGPLACLLAANLALVLLGLVLTVLALWAARGETREVQARLSIAGLVAARFEGQRAGGAVDDVRDLFAERSGGAGPRIGIVKSEEGGWAFNAWSGGGRPVERW